MKKKIALIVGLVIIIGAATLVIPRLLVPNFKQELASRLNVDAKYLHLNIPPAAMREPGFTFAVRGSIVPILFGESDDSTMMVGESFDLSWSTLSNNLAAGAAAAGFLDTLFDQSNKDKISLSATDCRILELPLAEVKARLLRSDAVLNAADSSSPVFVVIRSYRGTLALKVNRASGTTAEAWSEKVATTVETIDEAKLKVTSSNDREMTLVWQTPTVFAFEAMEAKLLTTHLGSDPNEVELNPITPESMIATSEAATATADSSKKN